ncbi:MAG: hypothetical protein ABFD82_19585 [Syntrophaceae bacterium]
MPKITAAGITDENLLTYPSISHQEAFTDEYLKTDGNICHILAEI